jgi:hypothetical protein
VLLGPIISRLFTSSNAEKNKLKKTKGAYSSPISMDTPGKVGQGRGWISKGENECIVCSS